jgi:hypothetical protein
VDDFVELENPHLDAAEARKVKQRHKKEIAFSEAWGMKYFSRGSAFGAKKFYEKSFLFFSRSEGVAGWRWQKYAFTVFVSSFIYWISSHESCLELKEFKRLFGILTFGQWNFTADELSDT